MATAIVADLDQRALSYLLQFVEPQRHTYKRCMSLVCFWITGCSHGDGALLVSDRRRASTNLRILGNLRPGPMRRNSLVTFLQTGGGENVCPPAEAIATVVTSIHFGPDMPDAASWD